MSHFPLRNGIPVAPGVAAPRGNHNETGGDTHFRSDRRQTLPWDYFRLARQPPESSASIHGTTCLRQQSVDS